MQTSGEWRAFVFTCIWWRQSPFASAANPRVAKNYTKFALILRFKISGFSRQIVIKFFDFWRIQLSLICFYSKVPLYLVWFRTAINSNERGFVGLLPSNWKTTVGGFWVKVSKFGRREGLSLQSQFGTSIVRHKGPIWLHQLFAKKELFGTSLAVLTKLSS